MKKSHEWKISKWDIMSVAFIISLSVFFYMYTPWIRGIGGDGGDGHYALWASCAKAWHNGEIPLWNPYEWGGYSSVGSIQEIFYPVLILLQFIFWDNSTQMLSYAILPAYIAIHFCIGGLGMYVLGKSRDKSSLISCVVSTLVIASGCFAAGEQWTYIFGSYCWIPWLILALYKLVETGHSKWIAFSGLILAMIGLCSAPHGVLFAILIYVIIYAVVVWEKRRNIRACIDTTIRFLTSGFIGMGLASIELFPFLESSMLAFRYIPGLENSEKNMKVPLALFKLDVINKENWNGLFGAYDGLASISVVALILIIVGMFSKRRKGDWLKRFSKILLIGSFLYSIGFAVPDIFWYIPGFNAIREPILYMHFFIIAGGILMFDGMEVITCVLRKDNDIFWNDKVSKKNLCNTILILVILISLLPHMVNGKLDFLIKVVVLVVFISIFFRRKYSKALVNCMLILIMLMNTTKWTRVNNSSKFYDVKAATEKVAKVNSTSKKFLNKLDDIVIDGTDLSARYLKWSSTAVLPANIAGIVDQKDCFAYLNPIYDKNYYVYQFLDLKKRCQLQNIKYILYGKDAGEDFNKWMKDVIGKEAKLANLSVYDSYDSNDKKEVYYIDTGDMNLGAGWVTNDILKYNGSVEAGNMKDAQNFMAKMNDPEFDLSKQVYVDMETIENANILEFDDSNTVNAKVICTEYKTNSITYDVSSNTDGILITTEFFYPGWKVKIDGIEDDVIQVDYAFRGVKTTEGEHVVEFYYAPNSLRLGYIVFSIAGILGIACVLLGKKEN